MFIAGGKIPKFNPVGERIKAIIDALRDIRFL
jgi:hypothetical protein